MPPSSPRDAAALLREVITALEMTGIPHMLVGSFASTAYSSPRSTQDIDIVVNPTPEALAGRRRAEAAGAVGRIGGQVVRQRAAGRRPGAAQRGTVHDEVGAGGGEQFGDLVGPGGVEPDRVDEAVAGAGHGRRNGIARG